MAKAQREGVSSFPLKQCYLLFIYSFMKALNDQDNESSLHFSFSILCLLLLFQFEEAAKGLSLSPIMVKLNSLRMGSKKGSVAVFDYQLLEAATNKFSESSVLDEADSGHVYKACFDEKFLAAVKKLECVGSDAERKVDVIFHLKPV